MFLGVLPLVPIALGVLLGATAAAVAIAVIALICITVVAVIQSVIQYFEDADELLILDPSTSNELEKVAKEYTSKKHVKYIYNRVSNIAVLVESDSIDYDLEDKDAVTINLT
jgi:hypothetical protein